MNIQEKAEQYARELHKSSIDFNGSYDIAKNAYVAGYNEAKRWIPVGERVPENHRSGKSKEVLCKYRDIKFFGYYDFDEKQFGKFGSNKFNIVDEWREI